MEGDSVQHPLHSKEAKNGHSGKEEWNVLWLLKQKSYWLSSWQTGMGCKESGNMVSIFEKQGIFEL